jgi:predicted nucleic acid-binding OB-fold protein
LAEARRHWREQVLADPAVLLSRLGPEVPCELPAAKVRLVAFDEEAAVRFDVNTVQTGILRLIPGIGETEIDALLAARTGRPFSGRDDFQKRAGLKPASLAALKF